MYPNWADASQRFPAVERQQTRIRLNRNEQRLQVSERTIRQVARQECGSNIAMILLRQAFYEYWLRLWKHTSFRRSENGEACKAYCAMSRAEFEAINARQRWANWRTIPRGISGLLPNRPLTIIDLCCGTGDSTAVLAYYAHPGSRIVGLENNPAFVTEARSRSFWDERGHPCTVTFNVQSVLEKFRDADGQIFQDGSVDWINCCGAIGCHFDKEATRKLSDEIARVLRPRGLATLDSGESGTSEQDLTAIMLARQMKPVHRAKSCIFDRYTQVCFQRR
ncbi:MAG TPA: class I SAM-dependent methyltransferase [Planctomycetota bacterium]|nr:class I SAM-dependent methyltransferase [Planctomycetota bacterium]